MATEPEADATQVVEHNGVVLVLDALGTKGLLANMSPSLAVTAWDSTVAEFREYARKASTAPDCQDCQVYAFSDTLIVTMDGEEYGSLLALMGQMVLRPFYSALVGGVYLRGVFSVGNFYTSLQGSMVIGPAVDEAAEWYELPNWMGVSASPSATYVLHGMASRSGLEKVFVPYPIPLKKGDPGLGWASAWPRMAASRNQLLSLFAGRSIGVSAAPKYRNTLAFYDYYMDKHGPPPSITE